MSKLDYTRRDFLKDMGLGTAGLTLRVCSRRICKAPGYLPGL